MTEQDAEAIAAWCYPGEYAFYDELGAHPEPDLQRLTGRGLGAAFLEAGLRFAGPGPYVLHVAAFNHRAITVYERAGFREVERYEHATNGGLHPFIRMERTA